MPKEDESRWTLAELIDFESALATWDGKAGPDREGGGRAAVMRRWLAASEAEGPGARWLGGLGVATSLMALLAAAGGAAAVWGALDRGTAGVNVVWMLAATLVLPWLLLLLGVAGWLLRGRVAGIGVLGGMVERLSLRFLHSGLRDTVVRVRRSGELVRVLAWHLATRTQWIAAAFHAGALAGLLAMVLFKRVGFFWETTTETAMRGGLENAVSLLSLPWAAWMPWAVPDIAASQSTRDWMEGGVGWWVFSLMALAVWGVLPRLVLAAWMGWKKQRALAGLTFQSPQHRKLWRALTEVRRGEEPHGPVDGALVITIGGASPDHTALRPFLLRRLRMNPAGWESLGVLDEGREEAAREALAKAPAGIVLFAEGWSLAPRQIEKALAEIAARADGRRQVLLVGNPVDGGLEPATDAERAQWERYIDARGGGELELVFYEKP
ncbi:MAG TPA: DUF2868 domain-containing protein [Luteolibacter sp.]|nr:DUF2868 domain-containing protein [Luteolibacter sp.]